jgi:hypothetical protein
MSVLAGAQRLEEMEDGFQIRGGSEANRWQVSHSALAYIPVSLLQANGHDSYEQAVGLD